MSSNKYKMVCAIRWEGSGFPFTEEHAQNQQWADQSWRDVGLDCERIKKNGHVYCHELVEVLLNAKVGCQIDSDIILTSEVMRVFKKLEHKEQPSWATSHRYCFDGKNYPDFKKDAKTGEPWGVSIFIGNMAFWRAWYKEMPKNLSKFGVMDDQAILSFGNRYFSENSYHFTDLACVYHPNHDGRVIDRCKFNESVELDVSCCGVPPKSISDDN